MKDTDTYGEKMARNGRTKDIYKGTFICIQTLFDWQYIGQIIGGDFAKFCGLLRIYELYFTHGVLCKNRTQVAKGHPAGTLIIQYP